MFVALGTPTCSFLSTAYVFVSLIKESGKKIVKETHATQRSQGLNCLIICLIGKAEFIVRITC